jgi:hypothetical protein
MGNGGIEGSQKFPKADNRANVLANLSYRSGIILFCIKAPGSSAAPGMISGLIYRLKIYPFI